MNLNLRCQFLSFALVLSGLGALGQDPVPAAPAKPTVDVKQWVETVAAQWQAAFVKEVTVPFDTEKARLAQQYNAGLEANLTRASGAGNLDLAVLWRSERDRFASARDVPAGDDPTVTVELQQLRAAWRTQSARLEKDRADRAKALHARYDQVLAQAQTQLTQRQRLEEAVLVKNKRDEMAASWSGPQAALTAAPAGTGGPVAALAGTAGPAAVPAGTAGPAAATAGTVGPAAAPTASGGPAEAGLAAGVVGTWRVRWPQNGWEATRTLNQDGTFTASDDGPGTWEIVEPTLILHFRRYQERFDLPLKPEGTKVIGYKNRELVATKEVPR